MTLIEHLIESSRANLPFTLNHEHIIELANIFADAEEDSELAKDITARAASTEHSSTGSYRLSASEVKYVARLVD